MLSAVTTQIAQVIPSACLFRDVLKGRRILRAVLSVAQCQAIHVVVDGASGQNPDGPWWPSWP